MAIGTWCAYFPQWGAAMGWEKIWWISCDCFCFIFGGGMDRESMDILTWGVELRARKIWHGMVGSM